MLPSNEQDICNFEGQSLSWSYGSWTDLKLHLQPVHITTNVASWNPDHGEVYSVQI
jgi:hypothetical protein